MGNLKDKALNKSSEKKFTLTDTEFNYISSMHVSRQRIYEEQSKNMSAFLYYIAGTRLGYGAGTNLEFELDFDNDKHELIVRELPASGQAA